MRGSVVLVLAAMSVVVLSAAIVLTVIAPAVQRPASQAWGAPTVSQQPTPHAWGWMGRMMGVCPCMGWMWGHSQRPQPQQQAPAREPDVELVVYAGDFGFGLRRDSITTPGPEIKVKRGSLVKLTLVNIGNAVHVLAVVNELMEDPRASPAIPGAQAGTPSNPLAPGQSVTVYFMAERPGTYFYVCDVPGHITLGMWGRFVVE